jgi:hypothetical protein
MLALELEKSMVKVFMGSLLREENFDAYVLRQAEIVGTVNFHIECGKPWGEMRPLVTDIVKRFGRPKVLRLVFAHAQPQEIDANAKALFINMAYEDEGVTFTTATAQREFSLDKSMDAKWDECVREFFVSSSIPVRDRVS